MDTKSEMRVRRKAARNSLIRAADLHIATIRAERDDETTQEIARRGIGLTYEQADDLGDAALDWLRRRLHLVVDQDYSGVYGLPRPRGVDHDGGE